MKNRMIYNLKTLLRLLQRTCSVRVAFGVCIVVFSFLHAHQARAAAVGEPKLPHPFTRPSFIALGLCLLGMAAVRHNGQKQRDREAELITVIKQQEQALHEAVKQMNYRLNFEKLVTSVAKRFITLNPEKIDTVIKKTLGDIGCYIGVDRCYIFRFSEDGQFTSNVYEWCAENIEPQIKNLQDVPIEMCPWLMQGLSKFESISIPVVDELPEEAANEKELFGSQSIQSVLIEPISLHGSLIGFLGFDAVREQKSWREEDQISLKMITEIFALALEKSRAERELFESRHFRIIAEASPIPVIISRIRDNKILYANREASHYLGVSSEHLIDQHMHRFYLSEKDTEKIFKGLEKNSTLSGFELEINQPDGSVANLQLSVRKLTYDGEEAIITGIHDITKRKAVEQALRESEERFRQLAANIDEVFWLSDPGKKKMYYVSPGYEKIWGQSCESLYNHPRSWFHAIHDDERSQVMEASLTIEHTNSYAEIYRIQRPDGVIRWIRERAFPIRDENGQVYRIAGVAEDITEMQRAEAKILKLKKQKIEIEKHAATGRMAARIAHEINNPLAGIKNAFSLIRGGIDPQYRHFDLADKIEREIDRIAKIVRQMYDLYRPNPEQSQEFDLNDTVRDVVDLLKVSTHEQDIPLKFEDSNGRLMVLLPEALVRQVLFNIIQNAIEASEPGNPVIVRTKPGQQYIEIAVIDRGSGIADDLQSKILEPFFTTKDGQKTGGLGLGLSISNSIVESLQGKLTFTNNDGAGTTVLMRLPVPARKGDLNG